MKNVFEVNGVKYRKCKVCKEDKPFTTEFFSPKNGKRDGSYWLRTDCKICQASVARDLRNIKKNAPRKMPDNCECCGRSRGKKSLCCDHSHSTGLFRGWICHDCNLGIGMTIDDPDIGHKNILRYYKKNEPQTFRQMMIETREVLNETEDK